MNTQYVDLPKVTIKQDGHTTVLLGEDGQPMAVILPTAANVKTLARAAKVITIYNAIEDRQDKWYKPSDIGKLFKRSGADVNTWLLECGLQERTGEKAWRPSKVGMPYSQEYQYTKAEGAEKGRIKWSADIVKMLLADLPIPTIQDAKSNEVAVIVPVEEVPPPAPTEDAEQKMGLDDLDAETLEDAKEDYILHSLALAYGDPALLETTTACVAELTTKLDKLSLNVLKDIAIQHIKENMQGPESRAAIAALIWRLNEDIAEDFNIDKAE